MLCIKTSLVLPAFTAILTLCLAQACASIIVNEEWFEHHDTSNTTNGIQQRCFDQHSYPGIDFTNLADCRLAMGNLVRQPRFRAKTWFSRNQRVGVMVPKEWNNHDCTIYVSCINDYDREMFSYADIARIAQNIITMCVQEKSREPYGGVEQVGKLGSFYVTVGRAPDLQLTVGDGITQKNRTIIRERSIGYATLDEKASN